MRDIPEGALTDPIWFRSGHTDRGRDGCRVPLPWSKDPSGAHGFSSDATVGPTQSWLPQPSWWGGFAVDGENQDPTSTLNMYKSALRIRREHSGLGEGSITWLPSNDQALMFERVDGFICIVNFGIENLQIPEGAKVLLSSAPLLGREVPIDTAVWLQSE